MRERAQEARDMYVNDITQMIFAGREAAAMQQAQMLGMPPDPSVLKKILGNTRDDKMLAALAPSPLQGQSHHQLAFRRAIVAANQGGTHRGMYGF